MSSENLVGLIHKDINYFDKDKKQEYKLPFGIISVGVIVKKSNDCLKIISSDFKKDIFYYPKTKEIDSIHSNYIESIIFYDDLVNLCTMEKEFITQAQLIIYNIYNSIINDIKSDEDYEYLNNEIFLELIANRTRLLVNSFKDISHEKFDKKNNIERFLLNSTHSSELHIVSNKLIQYISIIDNLDIKNKFNDLVVLLNKFPG